MTSALRLDLLACGGLGLGSDIYEAEHTGKDGMADNGDGDTQNDPNNEIGQVVDA